MNYATRKAVMLTLFAFALALLAWGGLAWWQGMRAPAEAPPEPAVVGQPAATSTAPAPEARPNADGLRTPEGFRIDVFASGLNNPRDLTVDSRGALLVSDHNGGRVLALPDADADGRADGVKTVLSGLREPHGIVERCTDRCRLYVAVENAVMRYEYDPASSKATNGKKIADLPSGAGHSTRSLLLLTPPGGDRLLVSVGSSCNVCNEEDERRAAVLIMDPAGGDAPTVFASGLRNAVFLAQHPVTGEVWDTEMGRDHLGDDLPPDEINILREGRNYGWPICYGQNIHDAEFDHNTYIRNPCQEPLEAAAHIDIPAHSAPLGLAFVPEEGWPEAMAHHLLVAFHGSWNRSVPTGYKVVRYPLDPRGNPAGAPVDFVSGFTRDGRAFGRPADVLTMPGGTTYISDDTGGKVYRVTRTGTP